MEKLRVKELAKERGLTSEDLARMSGQKISTIRNLYQNAVKFPRYATLAAVAKALGMAVEELYDRASDDTEPSAQRKPKAQQNPNLIAVSTAS